MSRLRQEPGGDHSPADRNAVSVSATLAVLIGVGVSLLLLGVLERFYFLLDCTPATFRIAVGSCLIGLALGPRMLRGATLRLARAARAKMAAERTGPQIASRSRRGTDRDLLWIATGVAGLAAGLGALMLPALIGLGTTVLDWGAERFLWRETPLAVFEACVVFASVCAPFALVGFFARCVHQLPQAAGRWDLRVTAWLLCGLGGGFALVGLLVRQPTSGAVLTFAGAVPLLTAAIVAVARASPAVRRAAGGAVGNVDEPDIGERWPAVLRVALCVGVVAALATGMLWSHLVRAFGMGYHGASVAAGGMLLASVALGVIVSIRRSGRVRHAIGTMGAHFAAAGVSVAVGVALFNLVVRSSHAPFLGSPGCWMLWMVTACAPLVVLGHAIGFGGIAVLSRRAWDTDTGSRLLRSLVVSAAVAAALVVTPLLEALGSYATMVAASLTLLATGGVLMIHEPARARRGNDVRLAGVFAAVIAMICSMPSAGSGWLADAQARRARFGESWWLTWEAPAGAASLSHCGEGASPNSEIRQIEVAMARLVDQPDFPQGSRACLVTLGADAPMDAAKSTTQIDLWSLGAKPYSSSDSPITSRAAHSFSTRSAMRTLRATRDRYDLIVVECRDWPPSLTQRVIASRMFQRTVEQLTPSGVLVVLLPADSTEPADHHALTRAIAIDAVAFAGFHFGEVGGRPCVAFVAGRGQSRRDSAGRWFAGLHRLEERESGHRADPALAAANADR